MAFTKVMVSVPNEFLMEIDRVAQEEHRSRSELMREAMRLYLEVQNKRKRPGDDPMIRRAVAVQDAISRLSPGSGEDSVDEIRQWRESHK